MSTLAISNPKKSHIPTKVPDQGIPPLEAHIPITDLKWYDLESITHALFEKKFIREFKETTLVCYGYPTSPEYLRAVLERCVEAGLLDHLKIRACDKYGLTAKGRDLVAQMSMPEPPESEPPQGVNIEYDLGRPVERRDVEQHINSHWRHKGRATLISHWRTIRPHESPSVYMTDRRYFSDKVIKEIEVHGTAIGLLRRIGFKDDAGVLRAGHLLTEEAVGLLPDRPKLTRAG